MTTFLWWETCRGRKEQVWNVPGWKLLMSTVFHNVFPFQGKYIIQNHLRRIVLKHVWHLATGCQVVLTSLGGGGGDSVWGCLFCSVNHPWTEIPGLRSCCGRTWKTQSFRQSLTLMLKGKTRTLKYEYVCARAGSATRFWTLPWHLVLKWICISKDQSACAAGAGVVSKHASCPVWLR